MEDFVVPATNGQLTFDEDVLLEEIAAVTSSLKLSSDVQETIDQILPSEDPLDKLDFNPIDYINQIFPNQQSLTNLEDVLNRMKQRILQLDNEISTVVRGQSNVEIEGKEALAEARQVILQLTSRIHEMKQQARKSEQMVNEITSDIKQLDNAKRNLTSSIIMLNNLHILVEGVEKLEETAASRQYGQTASLLQSCLDVLEQLEKHQHIPHIKQLATQVDNVRSKLSSQVMADFRETFEGGGKHSFQQNQLRMLAEACLVVDSLDIKIRRELLEWVIEIELSEYKAVYQENQDIAWLDKVDKRFGWLKKHLVEFEERFGRVFPPRWEVGERIAIEFCKYTSKELSKVMTNRVHELNVRLLLFAVSKTIGFENLLAQKYPGLSVTEDNPDLLNDPTFKPFVGLMSKSFEPHLSVYVDAQDKNLSQLIDQFIDDNVQKNANLKPSDTVNAEVFPSSGILFTQYRNCLVQCVQLSTGQPLVALASTFQKNLRDYAQRVLQNSLPKLGGVSSSLSNAMQNVSSTGSVLSAASSAAGLLQSFLKEGDTRFSKNDICTICSILLTANYCLETTQQLEKKLQEKVDSGLKESISMSGEQDLFHNIISNCLQLLIQDIEAGCEPSFTAMIKTNWATMVSPIGPSPYAVTMTSRLQQAFPFIRDNLQDARKYFALLCNKFATAFTPKFIANLFKCKPLNQCGAEQLLLDTHTLKKVLMDLPTWESAVKIAPGQYTKQIVKGMNKAEIILKVVLVPHDRIDSFIESSYRLLGQEADQMEFQKILDMKGIRRLDSQVMVEMLRKKIKENEAKESSTDNKSSSDANEDDSNKIKRLENMMKRM